MTERELLLKLRGRLAYKSQVKPYVIFKDTELEDLLKARPKTISALTKIKGFPKDGARAKKWGQSIIDIFNKSNEIVDFEVDNQGKVITKLKRLSLV